MFGCVVVDLVGLIWMGGAQGVEGLFGKDAECGEKGGVVLQGCVVGWGFVVGWGRYWV